MITRNPRSTASVAGHSIHPMLIPFPIAFFVATFACDLVFWATGNAGWADATLWLLGAGLIMAALAAVAGLTDFLGEQQIREISTAWWHAGGNVVAVLIELGNWYLRYAEGSAGILPTGIILSAAVTCILVFTGWKGWQLVYEGHVGVADELGADEPAWIHERTQRGPGEPIRQPASERTRSEVARSGEDLTGV